MNGKIQAISDKKLPKARSFKIGDEWYGVWLVGTDGKPTDLQWMASLAVGDILPEFEIKESGDFKNIVSAKAPVINVDTKGHATEAKSTTKDTSIECQTIIKAAAEMTAGALHNGALQPQSSGAFFQTKCEEAWEWLRAKC